MIHPLCSDRPGLSFSLFIHCQGRTACPERSEGKEQRVLLFAPLCPGNGARGRSGSLSSVAPFLHTSKAIVSPAPYQVDMNLLRFVGCEPMLKNYTGHFIREKVDILFRDSDDFLFRY